jgi:hypothetical protein
MSEIKIGIPLHGKMAARVFHQPSFREQLSAGGFKPTYFLSPVYFQSADFDPKQYGELKTNVYDQFYTDHAFLRILKTLRRFVVKTETTDLRFRELIEDKLFDASVWGIMGSILYINTLRHVPGIGNLLLYLEERLYATHAHDQDFKNRALSCILTPGIGNYGFWNEGYFALEAQKLGLPVFAAITNYDAIVNKGFRGFTPKRLAVWSQQMADETMQLLGISAHKIEVTGPVQYDRFFQPLPIERDAFLRSINLDPNKKTVFFAGGVNITHYYEIYRLFVEQANSIWHEQFNLVIRPYPHSKLLVSPGWNILEKLFPSAGVYISNPGSIDASGDRAAEFRQDLVFDDSPDELNYLLRYSDVMINYFSTISLEAALCDLPVIHIGYDSYKFGQRFGVTTAFQQRQTHNRRKSRLAASKVAKSDTELLKYLDEYLGDQTLDRDARHEYAISECGELDGKAGIRLLDMIKNHI